MDFAGRCFLFVSPYLLHVVKFPRTAQNSRTAANRTAILAIDRHFYHVPSITLSFSHRCLRARQTVNVAIIVIIVFVGKPNATDTPTNQLPFYHRNFRKIQNEIKNSISSLTYNTSIHAGQYRFHFIQYILNTPQVTEFRVLTTTMINSLPFR